MPYYIILLAVTVVVVVIAAYALGTYWRRRSDDAPPRLPPTGPTLARRTSAPAARPAEPADREVRVVVNWLLSQAFEQTGIRVADDKLAYDRIVEAGRKAVATLKTQEAVDISLPFLTADANGPKHLEARLTRDMIAELVKY